MIILYAFNLIQVIELSKSTDLSEVAGIWELINNFLKNIASVNVKNIVCLEEPVSLEKLHNKKTSRTPKHQMASGYSFTLRLCLMDG